MSIYLTKEKIKALDEKIKALKDSCPAEENKNLKILDLEIEQEGLMMRLEFLEELKSSGRHACFECDQPINGHFVPCYNCYDHAVCIGCYVPNKEGVWACGLCDKYKN